MLYVNWTNKKNILLLKLRESITVEKVLVAEVYIRSGDTLQIDEQTSKQATEGQDI